MTLDLNETYKDANPYFTNWDYLNNMTYLQTKSLNELAWDEYYKYISTELWNVPNIWSDGNKIYFIVSLNNVIKEL